MLFDSHAHLDDRAFDLEVSERCGHEQSAEHCDEKQQGDPRFCPCRLLY